MYLLSSFLFCGKYKQRCLAFCRKHRVLEGNRSSAARNLFMSLNKIKESEEYLRSIKGFK
jgi:hypothetical protein